MQDFMQAQIAPFVKLAQANMELLTQFSASPTVARRSSESANDMFEQATHAAASLMQSDAFFRLVQGLMNNYSNFLMELSQSTMGLMAQGQATLTRQAEDVAEQVIDAADYRKPRSRSAA